MVWDFFYAVFFFPPDGVFGVVDVDVVVFELCLEFFGEDKVGLKVL